MWMGLKHLVLLESTLTSTKTPCIKECKLQDGYCTGCARTVEQITNWSGYSDKVRGIIMQLIENRKKDGSFPPTQQSPQPEEENQ